MKTKSAPGYPEPIPFKEAKYERPHKNVLVISCIDLRLTDNLLKFLHLENLDNRYDHVTMAGASLCSGESEESYKYVTDFKEMAPRWQAVLMEHLKITVQLHQIQDVYIVEHADCGAYKSFLENGDHMSKSEELACHRSFAENLRGKIRKNEYYFVSYGNVDEEPNAVKPYGDKTTEKGLNPVKFKKQKLNVHNFMMNVAGDVYYLPEKENG